MAIKRFLMTQRFTRWVSPLRRGIGLCTLALLVACAAPGVVTDPGEPPQSAPRNESEEALELLTYFQRIGAMPSQELEAEYDATNAEFALDNSDQLRLRLILLLSVPGASFRDDGKLMYLLETAPHRLMPPNSAERLMLILLHRLNAERVRQVKALREEQRRNDSRHKEDNRRLENQLLEEQRRAETLQRKLDGLLGIERDMRQRRGKAR